MKTIIIYHSIDLDGWMSAGIVKYWFLTNHEFDTCISVNDVHSTTTLKGVVDLLTLRIERKVVDSLHFLGYNYGQEVPDLSDYDKIIMCDVSFPTKDMVNLVKKLGDKFIYIDHHTAKVREVCDALINVYGYSYTEILAGRLNTATKPEEKRAACELTWEFFFPNKPIPTIVELLGKYDSFRSKETDEHENVLMFQYGARMHISNYEQAYEILQLETKLPNKYWERIQKDGEIIYKYAVSEAKQSYKLGFDVTIVIPPENFIVPEGSIFGGGSSTTVKCLAINKERFNPINFGIDYHKDGYDAVLSFHYANGMYNFSIYNDDETVDCSVIAKRYGGGGHKGASGFRLTPKQFNNLIK